jgi:acylglycerol lipase
MNRENDMTTGIRKYNAGEGDELSYQSWSSGPHEKALVYLHGIESHSGWFADCAGRIEKMGVSVYAPDRRGSGLNGPTNGQSRGDCSGFPRLVDDVMALVRLIEGSHREVHIVGLSWGCKLAAAVDVLNPGQFSSMTMIAPGFFPRVMPGIGARLAIAFDALLRPTALHPIPIKDEMFTTDARRLRYIAADPLRLRKVTARFYLHNFLLDRFLKSKRRQWSAPTQILLAEHDAIIDNRRTSEMFESLEMENKRIHTYAGCRHSLQFENPDAVARDIVGWIGGASKG